MENEDKTLHILSNASGTNKELFNIKLTSGIGDIVLQLDGFNKHNDSSKTCKPLSSHNNINNSHNDVFKAILCQIAKTPQETTFLNILKSLLTIDPNESICTTKWQVLEKLTHRIIQLENCDDLERLLKVAICPKCHDLTDAPTLPPTSPLPPPPPPANLLLSTQKITHRSNKKFKTYNWIKIPEHKILNKTNVWTKSSEKLLEDMDFQNIEELFSLPTNNKIKRDSINKADRTDNSSAFIKREKQRKKLNLLDSQFSLKINIFLSQFKGYNSQDIVQVIRSGNNKIMDLEKLKDLRKFLQKEEAFKILKMFKGDYQDLGTAEKFLLMLLALPNYKLRIDCMIAKEEFALTLPDLEPSLKAILNAGQDLMANESLPIILHIIIKIGNYLNSGSFAGNALGFKLSSLNKLTEIRANKSGQHLLHFIVSQVESHNPKLMKFYNELNFLQNVAKINIEQISEDVNDLQNTFLKINKQVQMLTTEEDIKLQMSEFLSNSKDELKKLENQLEELKILRIEMANFFSEDLATFKVNECFEILHKFCEQFKQSVKDNEERQRLQNPVTVKQKPKEVVRVSPINTKPVNVDVPLKRRNLKILLRNHIITNNSSKQPTNNNEFLINKVTPTQNSNSNYNTQIDWETEDLIENTGNTQSLPLTRESSQETLKPRISLKTFSNIRRFGKCYVPINKDDLKKAIENLRPPNVDTNRFQRRYTVAYGSNVELRNKLKIKEEESHLLPNTNDENSSKLQRRNTVATPPADLQLGSHRYSSINEAVLKEAIRNLRPLGIENISRNSLVLDNVDQRNSEEYDEAWDEVEELSKLNRRKSLVNRRNLRRHSSLNEEDLKETIKSLRPITGRHSLTFELPEEENDLHQTEKRQNNILTFSKRFLTNFQKKFQLSKSTTDYDLDSDYNNQQYKSDFRKGKNSIGEELSSNNMKEKENISKHETSKTGFRKRVSQKFKKFSPFKS